MMVFRLFMALSLVMAATSASAQMVLNKGESVPLAGREGGQVVTIWPSQGYVEHQVGMGRPDQIAVSGDYLLVLKGRKLETWETASGLRQVASIRLPFRPYEISVSKNQLFLSGRKGRLLTATLKADGTLDRHNVLALHGGIHSISIADGILAVYMKSGEVQLRDASMPEEEKQRLWVGKGYDRMEIDGHYLYGYRGQAISRLNMDSTERKERSELERVNVGARIHDVVVTRGQVYVAADNGVTLLQSNASGLIWKNRYGSVGKIDRLARADDRIIAAGQGYLYTFGNVRGEHLELLSLAKQRVIHMTSRSLPGYRLPVFGDRSMKIIDLSQEMPKYTNAWLDQGQGINFGGQRKMDLAGNILFVADWFSGVHLYDVSEPATPRLVGNIHTPGSSKGVVVKGHHAYIADDDHGLQIADVQDPTRPRIVASLTLGGLAYTPVIQGNLLYMASHRGGVHVIDIHDPLHPLLKGSYDTSGMSWSIRVRDGLAYVADDEGGLLILDVHDPGKIRKIGNMQPGGRVEDVLLKGDIAYVAMFEGGVAAIDVSQPARPVLINRTEVSGHARGLDLVGDELYVADWEAGIRILDATTLQLKEHRDTPGASWGLKVRGDLIYVADWWAGLVTMKRHRSGELSMIDEFARRDTIRDAKIKGRFMFVSQGRGGIQVFEVSNGMNPTWSAGVSIPHDLNETVLIQDRLYALGTDETLSIIDVENPFEPHLNGTLKLLNKARKIWADQSSLWLETDRGVLNYTLDNPDVPQLRRKVRMRHRLLSGDGQGRMASVHERTVTLWTILPDGRLQVEARREFGKAIQRVMLHDGKIWCLVAENQLQIWTLERFSTGAAERIVQLPEGEIMDILPQEEALYILQKDSVSKLTINSAQHGQAWKVTFRFPVQEGGRKLVRKGGSLFLTGFLVPLALDLRVPQIQPTMTGGLNIKVPRMAPFGEYDLQDASEILHQAIRVRELRFSKPKMTLEQFKQLLKQHKSRQATVNGLD